MIVPTKGRPENAQRLLHAVNQTAGDELDRLVFAIDSNEPLAEEYQRIVPAEDGPDGWDWVRIFPVTADPQRMGPVLNTVAGLFAAQGKYTHIGFMGDDHVPRTRNWDEELVGSLAAKPGVAYGNDLAQGGKLPTACVISAEIIRSLGYMCPPAQEHLYLDDFWKTLGCSTRLVYRNDVVIEHLHPNYGKARWDTGYAEANSHDQYAKDQHAYSDFITGRWLADLARLKKDLGL
jgi:hypothetical protein